MRRYAGAVCVLMAMAAAGCVSGPRVEVKQGTPIATLEQGRDEARKLRAAGETEPITVRVHPGTYALTQPLELGAEDSNVSFEAAGRDKPVLLGGVVVKGFEPYKGNILKADLASQGLEKAKFKQMFYAGRRQILARYPNYDADDPFAGGWAYVDGERIPMYKTIEGEPKNQFKMKPGDLHDWAKPGEAMIFVFPRYNWWNNQLHVKTIDKQTRLVTTKDNASYPIRPNDRYYIYNVFEELDAPGEWYHDESTHTLYFYPPDGEQFAGEVVVPTLSNIVKIEGAGNVTLRGFTIEACDNTAVAVKDCTDTQLVGCIVRNAGWAGVTVHGGARCGVSGCDIYEVGSHGVSLSGGDRDTLTPAEHYADNNYIHHTGVFYKQGVGVALAGVGNRASHNLIHDCPRFGVMYTGNDQIIEFNHMRHLNLETSDTGATYSGGRDWLSPRGSVIRYNYIHDVFGFGKENHDHGAWISPHYCWGVYLDDNSAEVTVYGNIVVRALRGLLHFHCARDNTIENNIFVDGALQQIEMNGWGDYSRWIDRMGPAYEKYSKLPAWQKYDGLQRGGHPKDAIPMGGNRIHRNIMYYTGDDAMLYKYRSNATKFFDDFECDDNLIWHPGKPLLIGGMKDVPDDQQWAKWQEMGWDKDSLVADPKFVDAAADDYRLKSNSPAFKLGFKPIPVDKIGPYKSNDRASWPIDEAVGVREHGYEKAVPGLRRHE
ncbi:right-handed parallel beta-helix repeat-containing protein [Planctomycetales bacterium ZRK34]|nr:right-handed parallel beta-helix repeat-containing protein [Planctomycetales bacterium ZRK34]